MIDSKYSKWAIAICGTLAANIAAAESWPTWRGDLQGSGLVSVGANTYPQEWGAEQNVLWKSSLPDRGNSSPIIWEDKLFVTQATESEGLREVWCLDRNTGEVLWKNGVTFKEKESTHSTNPYCAASPVTDGKHVVATFGSAGVFCFDMDGELVWKKDLGPQEHMWGNASSPRIWNDRVFVYHGPGQRAFLIALGLKDGTTLWRSAKPEINTLVRTDNFRGNPNGVVCSFSAPILIKVENGPNAGREELIMSFPGQTRAFDPKSGEVLWFCDGLNPLVYTSPIYGEGLVVVMGGYGGTSMAIEPGGAGDVTATHRKWTRERDGSKLGSGLIYKGKIFAVNMNGLAECYDLKTGSVLWDERLRGPGSDNGSWSSLTRLGENIYSMNKSGDTIIFKASDKFETVRSNTLKDTTNATPAFADGKIYIRTDKALWAIGLK